MIAVQLDDVYRTLVSVDILKIIIHQESFVDVVDRLHEGYNAMVISEKLPHYSLIQITLMTE